MGRLIKWALLGGIMGAITVSLRSYLVGEDESNDNADIAESSVAQQSAKAGAAGAAVGAVAAVVVNRRARKNLSMIQRAGSVLHLDDLHLDKLPIEKLHLDENRARVAKQANRVGHAAGPRLHSAFDLLVEAADLARPVVEAAAARGGEVASHTAGAASSKVRSVRKR